MEIKTITIVGTGNVAWHLGQAFTSAGIKVLHIAGRDVEKAQQLSENFKSSSFGDLNTDMPETDVFLLAVKDDVIRTIAEKVYKPGRILVHCAGAIGADILHMPDNHYGVIWPMQTLIKQNAIDLKETLVAVSASSPELQDALKNLVSKITNRVIKVNDAQRAIMHLSAVWINNYTNHMYDIAYHLLKENDLPMELFFPMMDEHLSKLKTMNPDLLQTGPAIRGDMATLSKHKTMLEKHPDWQQLYDTLSKSILHKYLNK